MKKDALFFAVPWDFADFADFEIVFCLDINHTLGYI